MTFTVYAELAPEVSKKLERLAKKAESYGIPFSYSASEEVPVEVRVLSVDHTTSTYDEVGRHTVAGVNFEVECDGLIKANGWTICAKIEHGENGNIVTGFGSYPVKREWYTAAPNCDHCRVSRPRNVTFFVEREDGELRQVGSTCLKDYTGISPATAAMWAEIQDLMDRGVDCTETEWLERRPAPMYDVPTILAHACDVVREFGYRRSDEPNSTREMVMARVSGYQQPSKEGFVKAEKIESWLKSMDVNEASDLERNCISLVLSGYAKLSHIGRLAYMPVGFDKHQEYLARVAQREADRLAAAERSQHIGKIGERIKIVTASVTLLTSWDNQWGTTWLYKLVDVSGNVYIWKASKPCEATGGETFTATVKDHGERDGVKQTIVTRCWAA